MKTIEISGTARTELGKKKTAVLRKTDAVPCVVYGNGENISFSTPRVSFKELIYTPNAFLVNLDIDGKKETCVMREVQFHPVNDEIMHVDFYRVAENKPVTIDVPIVLKGSAEGVKLGGKLQHTSRKIKISALPKDLPDAIEVDINNLGLGKSIMVGDLTFEKGNILTPKTAVVCAVKMTRAALGAAAAAAAAANTSKKK